MVGLEFRTQQPQRAVGFVQFAQALDTRIVFGNSLAAHNRRHSSIPFLVDLSFSFYLIQTSPANSWLVFRSMSRHCPIHSAYPYSRSPRLVKVFDGSPMILGMLDRHSHQSPPKLQLLHHRLLFQIHRSGPVEPNNRPHRPLTLANLAGGLRTRRRRLRIPTKRFTLEQSSDATLQNQIFRHPSRERPFESISHSLSEKLNESSNLRHAITANPWEWPSRNTLTISTRLGKSTKAVGSSSRRTSASEPRP